MLALWTTDESVRVPPMTSETPLTPDLEAAIVRAKDRLHEWAREDLGDGWLDVFLRAFAREILRRKTPPMDADQFREWLGVKFNDEVAEARDEARILAAALEPLQNFICATWCHGIAHVDRCQAASAALKKQKAVLPRPNAERVPSEGDDNLS